MPMIIVPKEGKAYPTACGGVIRDLRNRPSAEFRGRTVYFCRWACLRAYESNPERFMSGQIPHPLEELPDAPGG